MKNFYYRMAGSDEVLIAGNNLAHPFIFEIVLRHGKLKVIKKFKCDP